MKLLATEPDLSFTRPASVQGHASSSSIMPSGRDIAARIFRQRGVFLITTLLVFLGFLVTGQFTPKYYSEMKILVRKEKIDPVATTDQTSTPPLQTLAVREEEVNSTVELLRDPDLLTDVAVKANLISQGDQSRKAAKAVKRLGAALGIAALPKTDLIQVSYESPDAVQSHRVLTTLSELFLLRQRLLGTHETQRQFFATQVREHETALAAAQQRLLSFTTRTGVVSASVERDMTVRRLQDLDSSTVENSAQIADATGRVRQIEAQISLQPERISTEKKVSDNAQLLMQLKGTLLSLELKRTDLLSKYDPGYRLVKDVDREIATTQDQLDREAKAPLQDATTSINPTYLALESDLVKARAELTGLRAKASQLNVSSHVVHSSAADLNGKDVEQDALLRDVATEKQQYELYKGKLEQADATDQNGILNVEIAEQPVTSHLPVNSVLGVLLASIFAALILSCGAAILADLFDPTIRTPVELAAALPVPVLGQFAPLGLLKGSEVR